MKGEAEQSFFVLVILIGDQFLDVEEEFGFLNILSILEDVDLAQLVGDKQTVRAVAGVSQRDRAVDR